MTRSVRNKYGMKIRQPCSPLAGEAAVGLEQMVLPVGDNNYELPRIGKGGLERGGTLPW